MPHMLEPGRACGTCTACCKTHGIADMNSGNGEWCSKCRIGMGCSIYQERPHECRAYQCFWLTGKGAESDRPDKLKIVMDGKEFQLGKRATGIWNMWEVEHGARLQPRVLQLTNAITNQGIVVRHFEVIGVNNLRQHFFKPDWMTETFFKQFKKILATIDGYQS